jgi:hypothetical protein
MSDLPLVLLALWLPVLSPSEVGCRAMYFTFDAFDTSSAC